jgi:hypothetical protein
MKIIHVHQQRIRQNISAAREGRTLEPPIIIRNRKSRIYANEITIDGPCKIVYSPDKPLDCGARLWLEVPDDTNIVIES